MAWSRRDGNDRHYGYGDFAPSLTVAERREQALHDASVLRKQGVKLQPVVIEGQAMATTFWGKAWCRHVEGYSDFASRLPRGRSYARHGAVIDLRIEAGSVRAKVSGSSVYTVEVDIKVLEKPRWAALVETCTGKIDSVVELLSGRLSTGVMQVLCDAKKGLFPGPGQLSMSCSCPDGAWLCKHLAATLYGVGARLDHQPELLFLLRGVDQLELLGAAADGAVRGAQAGTSLEGEDLSALFGIELDAGTQAEPVAKAKRAPPKKSKAVAKSSPRSGPQRKASKPALPRQPKAQKKVQRATGAASPRPKTQPLRTRRPPSR